MTSIMTFLESARDLLLCAGVDLAPDAPTDSDIRNGIANARSAVVMMERALGERQLTTEDQ